MKSIIGLGLGLGMVCSVYGQTIYLYKSDKGSVLTNKKKPESDTEWTYEKHTDYPDSNVIYSRNVSKEESEKEEIRVYKQQYKEWMKQGGKDSGIRPPTKPIKIEQELSFWPVLYGELWVGTGLIATDSIKINHGFNTHEDCMSNQRYYIQVYGKQLNLSIPESVKVAKQPKKTYSLFCYSTIGPVERSLVP